MPNTICEVPTSVFNACMLTGFAELLPWEGVHFGKRLTRIEEVSSGEGPVKLHFGDRTTSEVDCVVGADGVNSYVRRYLLGLDNPAAYPKNHEKWFIFHRLVPIEEARAVISPEKLTAPYIQIGPEGYAINMLINRGQEVSISLVHGISQLNADDDCKGQHLHCFAGRCRRS